MGDSEREPEVGKLFQLARKHEAAGLELRPGSPPQLWMEGQRVTVDMQPLTAADLDRLLRPILFPDQWDRLDRCEGVVFRHRVEEGLQFWVTVARLPDGLRVSAQRVGGA